MFGSVARGLAAGLQLVLGLFRRQKRKEAEETGAMKQREADQAETIEAQRAQLEDAVNRRPGDAKDRLDDGTF